MRIKNLQTGAGGQAIIELASLLPLILLNLCALAELARAGLVRMRVQRSVHHAFLQLSYGRKDGSRTRDDLMHSLNGSGLKELRVEVEETRGEFSPARIRLRGRLNGMFPAVVSEKADCFAARWDFK